MAFAIVLCIFGELLHNVIEHLVNFTYFNRTLVNIFTHMQTFSYISRTLTQLWRTVD